MEQRTGEAEQEEDKGGLESLRQVPMPPDVIIFLSNKSEARTSLAGKVERMPIIRACSPGVASPLL